MKSIFLNELCPNIFVVLLLFGLQLSGRHSLVLVLVLALVLVLVLIVKNMTSNSEWKFFFSRKTHERRLSLETGDNESNCESNFQCYVVMNAPNT